MVLGQRSIVWAFLKTLAVVTGELPSSKPPGQTSAEFRVLGSWKSGLKTADTFPLHGDMAALTTPTQMTIQSEFYCWFNMVSTRWGGCEEVRVSISALWSYLVKQEFPNIGSPTFLLLDTPIWEMISSENPWRSRNFVPPSRTDSWFDKKHDLVSDHHLNQKLKVIDLKNLTQENWGPKM